MPPAPSSTDLFQLGSSWAAKYLPAVAAMSPGVSVLLSRWKGSLWPHQMAMDGWWPSRSTSSRAWRWACLRMLRA